MTMTRAPEKAPNAKRGAARPDMPFVVCGGCGKRLRSTKAGLPRAHECGLPANTNARYFAELWGISPTRIPATRHCASGRAATTTRGGRRPAPRPGCATRPGCRSLGQGHRVRRHARAAHRPLWIRDPYTEWQEIAQTCTDA